MSFFIDQQTLDDLNLLGRFKQDSIFSLFNRVHTKSGEGLLMDMFNKPLTDPVEINHRSAIFSYFQLKAIAFPFASGQLNRAEEYRMGDDCNNYLFTCLGLLQKLALKNTVNDERYDIILTGIKATVDVLNTCKEFLLLFDEEEVNPYRKEIRKAKQILGNRELDWLSEVRTEDNWSVWVVAKFHFMLNGLLKEELNTLFDILYHLDVFIAVSNVARDRGLNHAWALPKDANIIIADHLRHPAIKEAVGNTISFNSKKNLVFLTGANMAGKSTLMKSIGINLYLAHMGFPVAVNRMEFSIKQGIYTSINVPDNLNQGYSHFYAEVLRVKAVAEQVSLGKDLVVIFDELFKGTNVKDAYDATRSVTAAFAVYRNCFFIISTHIIEVGETLRIDHPHMQFKYMPTIMDGGKPVYTYQLQDGISNDRHGMVIIENEGILDLLKTIR